MAATRTLIDSTARYDAALLGYDAPCDPHEETDGLIVTADADDCITILTGTGEVVLDRIAAEVLAKTLIASWMPPKHVTEAEYERTVQIQRGLEARMSGAA